MHHHEFIIIRSPPHLSICLISCGRLISVVRGDTSGDWGTGSSIVSIGFVTSSETGVIAVSIPAPSHHIRLPLATTSLDCSDSFLLSANSSSLLRYAALASRTTSSFVLPGPGAVFISRESFHPDQNLKLDVKLPSVYRICLHGFSRDENSQQSIAACEQRHIVVMQRSPKGRLAANRSSY